MPPHLSVLPLNTQGRDFVVGDVHGCYSLLRALLTAVGFYPPTDRLIAVGDLVDRGPASLECLELLSEPWFFSVRGNHEQMLLEHLRAPAVVQPNDPQWLHAAARSFTDRQRLAGRLIPRLERLPLVLQVGASTPQFLVVHAELLEERAAVTPAMVRDWSFSLPGKAARRALWGRALIEAHGRGRPVRRAHEATLPLIYCGHTIVPLGPIRLAHQVYLDGGAYIIHDDEEWGRWRLKKWRPHLRMVEPATKTCWAIDSETGAVHTPTIVVPDQL